MHVVMHRPVTEAVAASSSPCVSGDFWSADKGSLVCSCLLQATEAVPAALVKGHPVLRGCESDLAGQAS